MGRAVPLLAEFKHLKCHDGVFMWCAVAVVLSPWRLKSIGQGFHNSHPRPYISPHLEVSQLQTLLPQEFPDNKSFFISEGL